MTAAQVSDFPALVSEFGPAIQRVAASYERDQGLCEDLVQDMLVAIWKAWPRYRGDASPRTFILRIAAIPLSLIPISAPTRQADTSYAAFCLTKKHSYTSYN